jgi:hypothetical protein
MNVEERIAHRVLNKRERYVVLHVPLDLYKHRAILGEDAGYRSLECGVVMRLR